MPRQHEASVQLVSAWSEAAGYAANIALSLHKLRQLTLQRQRLAVKLQQQVRRRTPPAGADYSGAHHCIVAASRQCSTSSTLECCNVGYCSSPAPSFRVCSWCQQACCAAVHVLPSCQ